jgi:TRAP-type C4-dicarboxylate transport system substrate-binding protein
MIRPLVAALGAFAALACMDAAAQDRIVVKIGSITMNDTVHHMMKDYKARVERRAGSRITVEVYPASQLGAIPRQIEGVQLGTQEMLSTPPSFFVGVDRRFGVVDAPGLFDSVPHAQKTVFDPEMRKSFWTIGEPKGLVGLGMNCTDATMYLFRTPVKTLDDFKGKKIRVFASPMEFEVANRLGAAAISMSLEEVTPALQQGTIDGFKAGLSIFAPLRFYTTAKHVIRTQETIVCPIHVASKVWLDKLPADARGVLTEEAVASNQANVEFSLQFARQNAETWTSNGGSLYDLSPAEQAEFRRRVSTVGEAVTRDKPGEREMLELIQKAAARNRS